MRNTCFNMKAGYMYSADIASLPVWCDSHKDQQISAGCLAYLSKEKELPSMQSGN